MSKNPIVLTLWFVMELAGLFAQGYWAWTTQDGLLRILLVVGVPLVSALIWGIFRVPNDGGKPTVVVSGKVRLLIEVAFWGLTIGLLFAADKSTTAFIFGGVIVLLYVLAYDRVLRLWRGAGEN